MPHDDNEPQARKALRRDLGEKGARAHLKIRGSGRYEKRYYAMLHLLAKSLCPPQACLVGPAQGLELAAMLKGARQLRPMGALRKRVFCFHGGSKREEEVCRAVGLAVLGDNHEMWFRHVAAPWHDLVMRMAAQLAFQLVVLNVGCDWREGWEALRVLRPVIAPNAMLVVCHPGEAGPGQLVRRLAALGWHWVEKEWWAILQHGRLPSDEQDDPRPERQE